MRLKNHPTEKDRTPGTQKRRGQ